MGYRFQNGNTNEIFWCFPQNIQYVLFPSPNNNKTITKPAIVVDYNMTKGAVDLSDQIAAYQTPLRKTLKLSKKIAFDLILNVAMVNALVLYKNFTNIYIPIVDMRKQILKSFLPKSTSTERSTRKKHVL